MNVNELLFGKIEDMITGNLLRIKIACSALDNCSHMTCICLHHLFRKAKITDLGIHVFVQQNIAALYIAVYDSWFIPIMQIIQSFNGNENCVKLHLLIMAKICDRKC